MSRLIREWFGSTGNLLDVALFLSFFGCLIVLSSISQRGTLWIVAVPCLLVGIFVLRHVVRARLKIRADPEPAYNLRDVSIGGSVVEQAHRTGGQIYVWAAPFSRAWNIISASTEQPSGYKFERYEPVNEVELYVTPDILTLVRLRIRRRWWPRKGIRADNGSFLVGGGGTGH